MKKVLIALERESFNYLFKFNDCDMSLIRIIDEDLNSFHHLPLRYIAKKIEHALPYFESEDEVVLIEYLKENIQFGEGIRIAFDGVLGILPLSTFAKNSLESRLKNDFRIYAPIQEELLKDIRRIREDKKRINSVNKLLGIFNLQIEADFSKNLRSIVIKSEVGESLESEEKKALVNLINFDRTPSFIPSGNVESFLKLGCIFLLTLKADINLLMNGPFYRIITENKDLLNSKNLFESYVILQKLFEKANNEDKVKLNTPEKTFNKEFNGFNAFLAYFIYLSLNRLLQSKDYNLFLIKEELEKLKKECPNEFAHALAIFGYVHSFDRLYESIHRLSNSPLFKTTVTIKNDSVPIQFEQGKKPKLDEKIEENLKNPIEKIEDQKVANKNRIKDKSVEGDAEVDRHIIKEMDQNYKTGINQESEKDSGSNTDSNEKSKAIKSTPKIPNYGELFDKIDIGEIEDDGSDGYPEENEKGKVETFKEFTHQSIDSFISKIRFQKDNKSKRDKMLEKLNAVLQSEVSQGEDSFSFQTIEALILSIANKDSSLQDIAEKIISKLKIEFET